MENNVWVPAFSVGPQLKFSLSRSSNTTVTFHTIFVCDVASLMWLVEPSLDTIIEEKMIGLYRLYFYHLQMV